MSEESAYTVRVIYSDKATAETGNPGHCAYANAIKRIHPEWSYIQVGRDTITVNDRRKGLTYVWRTPFPIADAQHAFDEHDENGLTIDELAFPDIVLRPNEARIKPIAHDEVANARQNRRRERMRKGEHIPIPYSDAAKAARRARRRAG